MDVMSLITISGWTRTIQPWVDPLYNENGHVSFTDDYWGTIMNRDETEAEIASDSVLVFLMVKPQSLSNL